MRQSQLFTKTTKEAPKDEVSVNAELLIRAGFVDKLTAGVYSYLPLGLRVLRKIQSIVRREMDAIGGQEISMPALTPKEPYMTTGRWDEIDVLFKLDGAGGKEYALGATHEEIVTPLVKRFVQSYKDLPVAVYQIQDKFRNEPRAKSGLMRGREFNMKDLYSFHANEESLEVYYEKVTQAYLTIFDACGLEASVVEASGGVFSKYSHEFQVPTEYGEDIVYFCAGCGRHQNKELVQKEGDPCPHCGSKREEKKTIEVGNIFKLKTKFSDAFDFRYADEDGNQQDVIMGCYGIGPSRVLGAAVEVHHDEHGMVWPESLAPFRVHLVSLVKDEEALTRADALYRSLQDAGIDVLYDDRIDVRAGEKFADSDLIGIPYRVVVSKKTLEQDAVELKLRAQKEARMIPLSDILKELSMKQ